MRFLNIEFTDNKGYEIRTAVLTCCRNVVGYVSFSKGDNSRSKGHYSVIIDGKFIFSIGGSCTGKAYANYLSEGLGKIGCLLPIDSILQSLKNKIEENRTQKDDVQIKMNRNVKLLKQAYELSKAAKIGETCVCPSCGAKFIKASYQQAFCKSLGKTVCKDHYWNNVIPEKRNNRTRISPASKAFMESRKEKDDYIDYVDLYNNSTDADNDQWGDCDFGIHE
jgi:hypothetical protein